MSPSDEDGYTLRLTEPERMRYRMMAAAAVEKEAGLWAQAGIIPGARVADVGCGPGAVLAEIGKIVGAGGTVVGIEPGQAAREAAREELDAIDLTWVDVRKGTGEATGLESGSWDCVMVRHVLVHAGAAADRIVAHLATLLAPGGHLYLVDTDVEATRVSPPDAGIEEQLERYAEFHRSRGNDVRIGARLGSMLRAVGLEVVDNQGAYQRVPALFLATAGPLISAQGAMLDANFLQPDEVEQWQGARQRFGAQPDAELWFAGFRAVGRRTT